MISHFILFVQDQNISRNFYEKVFSQSPRLDVPGMTEFELSPTAILGLMPKSGVNKLFNSTITNNGSGEDSSSELYLRVDAPEEFFNRALAAGAKLISPIQERNWGNRAGYFKDLDGNLIAFSN